MQTNNSFNNRFLGAGGPIPQKRGSQAATAPAARQSPSPSGNQMPPQQAPAAQPMYYTPVLMAPPPLEPLADSDFQKKPGFFSKLTQKLWFMISEEAPPDRPIGIRQITRNSVERGNAQRPKNTYFRNGLPTQDYRLNAQM